MKRMIVLEAALSVFFAVTVLAACFAPAFATQPPPYYSTNSAIGSALINIAGHGPQVKIVAIHWDGGDYGVGDYIEIQLWNGIRWSGVGMMTDSPLIADIHKDFVMNGRPIGNNIRLVKHSDLEVNRGNNNVLVDWKVPLVGLDGTTLMPPGRLHFKGYGSETLSEVTLGPMPNRLYIRNKGVNLAATVTFHCQEWNYNNGPVGDESTYISTGSESWVYY